MLAHGDCRIDWRPPEKRTTRWRLRAPARRAGRGRLAGFEVQPSALVEALHGAGGPPIQVAQQLHEGRHQRAPDDKGIDQHGEAEPDSEELDRRDLIGDQAQEDHRHEEGGRRDDAAAALQARRNGLLVGGAVVVLFLDPRDEEAPRSPWTTRRRRRTS